MEISVHSHSQSPRRSACLPQHFPRAAFEVFDEPTGFSPRSGRQNKAWGEGVSRNSRGDRQEFISPRSRATANNMGRFGE